jgi:hypothetical protein
MAVFDEYRADAYPFRFVGTLEVPIIVGGTPSDPKVAEGWIKTKMGVTDEAQLQALVAETMLERGVTAEEAIKIVNSMKNLNGFKRDDTGLYIEGRQLKAALKEAANIAVAVGKLEQRGWGLTRKWALGFLAEHINVTERKLYLGVSEPTGVKQDFVHTHRGTGISYHEYVEGAKIDFTIISDYYYTPAQWAAIWLVGEQQGIGASRSQGYGRYEVVKWEPQFTKADITRWEAQYKKGKKE